MTAGHAASRDLIVATETVFPPAARSLAAVIRYTNATEIGLGHFARSTLRRMHRPRDVAYGPVTIDRLPPSTRLLGGGHGWVETDGTLVAEQINPLTDRVSALFDVLRDADWPTIDIDEPCLLLSRYGDATWGHWLCEILPRAAVAEHAFPKRFRYVVPAAITKPTIDRSYATAVLESLRAYGIDEDRLLRIDVATHYRFRALHLATGLWSPGGIHPDLVDLLRTGLHSGRSSHHRLAVLRTGVATRNVFNETEIAATLEREGFRVLDPVATPFVDQVAAFRGAATIFGVVGSGMSGLIYARDGVGVVGAAPGLWPDSYFQSVMQLRDARFADVRGPTVWAGDGIERDAPFVLNPRHLRDAIRATEQEPPSADIRLGDCRLPRRLGEVVLRIDFSAGGNSASYRGVGWSSQEAGHVWSDGPVSTLRIPPGLPSGALILELSLFAPVARPYLVARAIDIAANGRPLGRFDLEELDTVLCTIPEDVAALNDDLTLVFGHPFCLPASVIAPGGDDRMISAAFIGLTIRRLSDAVGHAS